MNRESHRRHTERSETTDGFAVSGNSSVRSLAHFYGLKVPVPEPRTTLADFLARNCPGRPRVGSGTNWDRLALVVKEMEAGAISKVWVKITPLRERRDLQSPPRNRPRFLKERRKPHE